ncbi:arylphorin subunit alpha-like [Manduca sexta]|uniref:arylphorin subunit alpha-like n=1 Tax=Manduca sexta TaxID=7130 RepID=UPI00188EEE10|nr:arylphorin subunit alpha-like [Manduca sexta]
MLVVQIIWLLLGAAAAAPSDEFRAFINEGELSVDEAKYIMHIVPSGFSPQTQNNIKLLPDVANDNNEYFKAFNSYIEKGITQKGLTFNIYDDDMREATIALFRFLQNIEHSDYETFVDWAKNNINKDMLNYAIKVNYLYSLKLNRKLITQVPCYIEKPNFFVNSETIVKALGLRGIMNYRGDLPEESTVNQYYQSHGFIVINTNYSGWNLAHNGGDEEINYFREDIALNCYYLGVHLLHPFWMSNEELDVINPRHAEHYYYTHQQLVARYQLEKEHLKQELDSEKCKKNTDKSYYNPHLIYDNGLAFPFRPSVQTEWSDEKAKIKSIDIAIRECIARGFIIMDNGTTVNMIDDNYVNMLAKLIRANLESVRMTKTIRSLFGAGGNRCNTNEYNPAPSILHHPETTLRDPIYWQMIQYVLGYFTELKDTMEPFDLSEYETEDFTIIGNNFTKIVTYFDYYQFSINKVTTDQNNYYLSKKWPIFARQRRLKHLPFSLNITVQSSMEQNVIVRLFLGPKCDYDCWSEYSKFYELDSFHYSLQGGINDIIWSPEKSSKYSFFTDENLYDYYNPHSKQSSQKKPKYNMYKFPGNLLIPKGIENGLDLKLFVMLTHADDISLMDHAPDVNYYKQVSYEVDSKPLGFPFHRRATGYNNNANNYKFYDVTIYHKRHYIDESGSFSPHLY